MMKKNDRIRLAAILFVAALLGGCAGNTAATQTASAGNGQSTAAAQTASAGSGQSTAAAQTTPAGSGQSTAAAQQEKAALNQNVSIKAPDGSALTQSGNTAQPSGSPAPPAGAPGSAASTKFHDKDVRAMLPVLQALALADYQLNEKYSSTNPMFVDSAVYNVLNSYTAAQAEDRGITWADDGRMRVPVQAAQEIANAMFETPQDIDSMLKNQKDTYLVYDESWDAFLLARADGAQEYCEITSWEDLRDGSCKVELALLNGEGRDAVTLGYADAVLAGNPDAEFIAGPLYPYTVKSFQCDVNGRDVAIGYPEK